MNRKNILSVIALVMVFALALTGCGKDKAPAEPEKFELALSDWNLGATAWSSNNGANVTVSVTPLYYYEETQVTFVARLEGEEVESAACEWDGTSYTASMDLNAADGYCYYVTMVHPEGAAEFDVNTPANPSNGKLINMEHSLETYCHMAVTNFKLDGNKLTITDGSAEIQLPLITRSGEDVACDSAELILTFGGEEVDRAAMTMPASQSQGFYAPDVKGLSFEIPQLEDDQLLTLTMEVKLNDGQVLTAPGGSWFYTSGQLDLAVG